MRRKDQLRADQLNFAVRLLTEFTHYLDTQRCRRKRIRNVETISTMSYASYSCCRRRAVIPDPHSHSSAHCAAQPSLVSAQVRDVFASDVFASAESHATLLLSRLLPDVGDHSTRL